MKTESELATWPLEVSVSVSGFVLPVQVRCAPEASAEFAQPCPAAPSLAHGQGIPPPSP
jgi:hypothetical protein